MPAVSARVNEPFLPAFRVTLTVSLLPPEHSLIKTLTSKSSVLLALLALSSLPAYAQNGVLRVNSFPCGRRCHCRWRGDREGHAGEHQSAGGSTFRHGVRAGTGMESDTRTITIVPGSNELNVTLVPANTAGPQGPQGIPVPLVPPVRRGSRVFRVKETGARVRRHQGLTGDKGGPQGAPGIQDRGRPVPRVRQAQRGRRVHGATGNSGHRRTAGRAAIPLRRRILPVDSMVAHQLS